MSKLVKVAHKIFGSLASYGQLGKVGSFKNGAPEYARDIASSENLNIEDIQSNSNFEAGLYDTIVGNGAPLKQDMNAILRHSSRQIGYLYQQGIPEWDALTTYFIGSICVYGGKTYRSLVDSNLNQVPAAGSTKWILTERSDIVKSTAIGLVTAQINNFAFNVAGLNFSFISSGRPVEFFFIKNGLVFASTVTGIGTDIGLEAEILLNNVSVHSEALGVSDTNNISRTYRFPLSCFRPVVDGLVAGTTYNVKLLIYGFKITPAYDDFLIRDCQLCVREL